MTEYSIQPETLTIHRPLNQWEVFLSKSSVSVSMELSVPRSSLTGRVSLSSDVYSHLDGDISLLKSLIASALADLVSCHGTLAFFVGHGHPASVMDDESTTQPAEPLYLCSQSSLVDAANLIPIHSHANVDSVHSGEQLFTSVTAPPLLTHVLQRADESGALRAPHPVLSALSPGLVLHVCLRSQASLPEDVLAATLVLLANHAILDIGGLLLVAGSLRTALSCHCAGTAAESPQACTLSPPQLSAAAFSLSSSSYMATADVPPFESASSSSDSEGHHGAAWRRGVGPSATRPFSFVVREVVAPTAMPLPSLRCDERCAASDDRPPYGVVAPFPFGLSSESTASLLANAKTCGGSVQSIVSASALAATIAWMCVQVALVTCANAKKAPHAVSFELASDLCARIQCPVSLRKMVDPPISPKLATSCSGCAWWRTIIHPEQSLGTLVTSIASSIRREIAPPYTNLVHFFRAFEESVVLSHNYPCNASNVGVVEGILSSTDTPISSDIYVHDVQIGTGFYHHLPPGADLVATHVFTSDMRLFGTVSVSLPTWCSHGGVTLARMMEIALEYFARTRNALSESFVSLVQTICSDMVPHLSHDWGQFPNIGVSAQSSRRPARKKCKK